MAGFTESSITLNFPDDNYFRFADCKGYTVLSGNYFKEMDACWFDQNKNWYWLIELKDFSLGGLEQATIEQKSWNIVKKAVDSLCMFLSIKHKYEYAKNLNPCLPSPLPDNNTELKFITIVHCKEAQKSDIQLLHNSFRKKFKPYATIFGITHYAVIEHSSAIKNMPNNMIL
jgi:hypothetical protein